MSTKPSLSPLWIPSEQQVESSNLMRFKQWLEDKKGLSFADYEALWSWSVQNLDEFWKSIWTYFEIGEAYSVDTMQGEEMPDYQWFEGQELNYVEHLFRRKSPDSTAIHVFNEKLSVQKKGPRQISWGELRTDVAALQKFLIKSGVSAGDRIVAFMPNIPETSIGFMSAVSLGCIWSSCSPDFGASSVIDRFAQINPKVLIATNGYYYNGKGYDKRDVVAEIAAAIPSLEKIIWVEYLEDHPKPSLPDIESYAWTEVTANDSAELEFVKVPFDHPIWVLYSSGTTGIPKAITHSHGGVLLEHYKYLTLQNDVKPGENFFWFSTTGWMMWNYLHAAFLADAAIVLYDGSPGYPDLEMLWHLVDDLPIHHFGTSAPFLVACMKRGMDIGEKFNLSSLRSIGSTGSPLPPEAFDYVYEKIKKDLWLCSMSGGTDVCTAFVGSSIWKPVYAGEIQCRALGVDLVALGDKGDPVINEVGEMVIRQPMPSMPIFFWNDAEKKRYKASYFEMYPGIWRHGDWVAINDRGGIVIYGRSDATLNRQGVRIGTAEIYRALNSIPEVKDGLIVNIELADGKDYMPLFVMMQVDEELTEDLMKKIKTTIRKAYSPRHVPDEIFTIPAIPYTISGKKLEAPVKKILMGGEVDKVANRDAMRNPGSLDFFVGWGKEKRND